MKTRRYVLLLLVSLLFAGLPWPEAEARRRRGAQATVKGTGKISGQLRIVQAQPQTEATRAYWSFGVDDLQIRRPGVSPKELVVFLDLWDEATALALPKPELLVEGARSSPHLLVIPRVGDSATVTFRNEDGLRYQFTASPDHADLRNVLLPPKGRENVKVGGIPHRDVGGFVFYRLRTQEKPDVDAEILFLRSSAFARPEAEGRFLLEGLPAGKRTLRVYYRGKVVHERSVDVGRGTTDLGALKITLKGTR